MFVSTRRAPAQPPSVAARPPRHPEAPPSQCAARPPYPAQVSGDRPSPVRSCTGVSSHACACGSDRGGKGHDAKSTPGLSTGPGYRTDVRCLEIDGLGRVSKIGLGTWQFGAREWGYGWHHAEVEAGAIVPLRTGVRGHAVRHGRDLRVRPQRADPRSSAPGRSRGRAGGDRSCSRSSRSRRWWSSARWPTPPASARAGSTSTRCINPIPSCRTCTR